MEAMDNLHIMWKGRTENVSLTQLGVTASMTDTEIMERVAQHYDRALQEFDDYVVQRESNGNITFRPEAEFGF